MSPTKLSTVRRWSGSLILRAVPPFRAAPAGGPGCRQPCGSDGQRKGPATDGGNRSSGDGDRAGPRGGHPRRAAARQRPAPNARHRRLHITTCWSPTPPPPPGPRSLKAGIGRCLVI